ncbi:MAG: hypothetical protein ACOYYS_03820 [Chloroflexota bacterium]
MSGRSETLGHRQSLFADRPRIPVDKDAPMAAFEAVAPAVPVFKVTNLAACRRRLPKS